MVTAFRLDSFGVLKNLDHTKTEDFLKPAGCETCQKFQNDKACTLCKSRKKNCAQWALDIYIYIHSTKTTQRQLAPNEHDPLKHAASIWIMKRQLKASTCGSKVAFVEYLF